MISPTPPRRGRRRLAPLAFPLALAALFGCTDDPAPTAAGHGAVPRAVTATAATATVSNASDAGPGSLREAIAAAPATGGLIQFDAALAGQTITLVSELQVPGGVSLTIEGPASNGITLSGGGKTRVMRVVGALVLRNLTVTGGFATQFGGGIFNDGELTLDHVTVAGNSVSSGDSDANGGGIYSAGSLTVTNSTISGNYASESGGGIYSPGASSVQLRYSTVAYNTADKGGGGVDPGSSLLALSNTIIANNTGVPGGEDCLIGTGGQGMGGRNLFSTGSCSAGFEELAIVANPRLGPLTDNGGPAPTHALLSGSPGIDATIITSCALSNDVDQRYVARPQGWSCDIGAFEFDDFPAVTLSIDASGSVSPTTGAAIVSGTMTCPVAGTHELRVELSQTQKLGRLETVAQASEGATLSCDGTRYWSVVLVPPSGGFKNGIGSVTAKTLPPSNTGAPYVTPGAATRDLKLYWGRK